MLMSPTTPEYTTSPVNRQANQLLGKFPSTPLGGSGTTGQNILGGQNYRILNQNAGMPQMTGINPQMDMMVKALMGKNKMGSF